MLELAVKIAHAGKHGRTARAKSVRLQSFLRGGDDFGMIGESEIIVGTKIDDRLRLAVILDRRSRIGWRQ